MAANSDGKRWPHRSIALLVMVAGVAITSQNGLGSMVFTAGFLYLIVAQVARGLISALRA